MTRRRWALALFAIIGGAALAAPLPVLELDGAGQRALALDPGSGFSYEYRQSIYDVPVEELFRVEAGRLRLVRVRSPARAALEYFRWPGEVRADGEWLSIDAPVAMEEQLTIRIAAGAEQRLRTGPGHRVALDGLGAEVVRVRAASRPVPVWLALRLVQEN